MKHIHQDQPGDVSVLKIKESPLPQLKQDEVLMKISYTAINRTEILQREGKVYPSPGHSPIIGLEASGYVVDGKGKELYPAVGLFSGGSYAQYAAIHKNHVFELPKGLTLEQGAAIPEAWITAYQLIKYIGKVQKNDYVMIYAAASGVGTAAIQLAKYFGAHAIASSSSDDKLKICKELGAELCMNYKTCQNQDEEILKFTNGKGVNLVLDCVGAQNYKLTDKILGVDGKWILYGSLGGTYIEKLDLGSLMRRRASLITTLLKTRSDEYKSDLISNFKNDTIEGFSSGQLKPIIDRVINITWDEEGLKGWRDAHTTMENNENIGKIVVAYPKI
ncbi:hypothetical protein ABPG72_005080 [Tetrahymena utriculariae]